MQGTQCTCDYYCHSIVSQLVSISPMEFRRWEINLAIEKFAYNQHKQHLQLQSKTQVMVNIISSGEKGQEKMRRDFLPS